MSVRGLLICVLLWLSGCSPLPEIGETVLKPAAIDTDQWTSADMAAFNDGAFHPAVSALFSRAQQAREQGQWQRAMTYLDQARQIQPRNAAVFLRQAWVALQMRDFERARQLAQRGLVFSETDKTRLKLEQLVKESER